MEKSTKGLLIGLVITLLIVIILIAIFPSGTKERIANFEEREYKGKTYYVLINEYDKEYSIDYISLSEYFNTENSKQELSNFQTQEKMTYTDYKNFCNRWGITQKYNDKDKDYIVLAYASYGSPNIQAKLADVKYKDSIATLYLWDRSSGYTADVSGYVLVIPTSISTKKVEVVSLVTEEEYSNIKKYGSTEDPSFQREDKPIIYLYPTKEQNITVKYINEENLLVSYPKYENEWNVKASPNGKLIDNKTGRELYALYYESKSVTTHKVENEGFVIKGSNTAEFLEEKLEILGLNNREAEEFIVYWLPILEQNEYNYIRFATKEEIEINSPLEVTPTPETEIRILMTYKGLNEKIDVKEQKLTIVERKGYTLVEWGGLEIK